jgi:hypothetical protein
LLRRLGETGEQPARALERPLQGRGIAGGGGLHPVHRLLEAGSFGAGGGSS